MLDILNKFGLVWTSLDKFGHIWTSVDTFGQVWTFQDMFGHVWTSIDKLKETYRRPRDSYYTMKTKQEPV